MVTGWSETLEINNLLTMRRARGIEEPRAEWESGIPNSKRMNRSIYYTRGTRQTARETRVYRGRRDVDAGVKAALEV